ncbi:MAG: hypothetical protein PVG39_29320 [Desulfobacteraceae bacterium]|jgi:hypothetical protein
MNGKTKIVFILSGVIVLLVAGLFLSMRACFRSNSDLSEIRDINRGLELINIDLVERERTTKILYQELGKLQFEASRITSDLAESEQREGQTIAEAGGIIEEFRSNNKEFKSLIEKGKN